MEKKQKSMTETALSYNNGSSYGRRQPAPAPKYGTEI